MFVSFATVTFAHSLVLVVGVSLKGEQRREEDAREERERERESHGEVFLLSSLCRALSVINSSVNLIQRQQ